MSLRQFTSAFMFLKQLKLSGFKSFVEPTIIPLAKSLIGVVGPNGCGKSNIIDAVRWVMGESSAKSLRGDVMTDVIFNGSTTRKPQGQALVELLFDNSLGRLVGQYAAYQEIAVKRVVSRDGESSYFLNGTRCRRRDITDLFLGTGAGVRGYAIIGQGTISRLIEARPDELRVYLEEAAGVSKYKDRRKETCQRMAHTRENLARIADIQIELSNHLQRLAAQTQVALEYQSLKNEEQHVKAIILILKQRACILEKEKCTENIALLARTVEQHQLLAAASWQENIRLKEQWHHHNEIYQRNQTLFYEHKTELARLEATLKQIQRDTSRLQAESAQIKTEHAQLRDALQQCQQQRLDCDHTQAGLLQEQDAVALALAQSAFEKQQVDSQLESAMAAFFANEKRVQQAHHEQTRAAFEMKHHLQRLHDLQLQVERLDREYAERQAAQVDETFDIHEQALCLIQNDLLQIETQIEKLHDTKNTLRVQINATQQQRQCQQTDTRKMSTQMATLQATIDTVLGNQTCPSSMNASSVGNAKRIITSLCVEPRWQDALNMVLGTAVRGYIVADLDAILPHITQASSDDMVLTQACASKINASFPRLVDYITGDIPSLPVNLQAIYIAETLTHALIMRPSLKNYESVLTPDGYWLSRHWFFSKNFKTKQVNILAKQAQLAALTLSLQVAEQACENIDVQYAQLQASLHAEELRLDALQKNKEKQLALQHQHTTTLAQKKEEAAQQIFRLKHIAAAREELCDKLEALNGLQEELIQQSALAEDQLALQQDAASALAADLNRLKPVATQANQALETVKQHHQTNHLARQKLALQLEQYQRDIDNYQQRCETIIMRLETIQTALEACQKQEMPTQNLLHEKMNLIALLEEQLREQQLALHDCNQQIEEHVKCHQDEEKKTKLALEKQQKATIEEQVLEDRNRHFSDALKAIQPDITTALKDKIFDFTLDYYLDKSLKLMENIERLGAVNLSAIEEFACESERKNQLDAQYQDLQDALTILEAAINKIDQETQQRFATTFDAVNSQFKLLFPKLFGGGRAELSLTCDNLLEAGILVTAQPPGKRNASIHLLSGGEKAMTAVALIFAIFQLNPSPFCMLDEVDAPLDDVNIARFCELVKEMSNVVQFLFITHNKVTMTLAEQLIGVTTREAGVSRIVTVDVEEAVELCHSEK